jgi:hypothetical protein
MEAGLMETGLMEIVVLAPIINQSLISVINISN